MKCRHCGKEIPAGYKFCGYCGKEQRSCPKCGQDVPSDMLYCGHCGVKMEQSNNPEIRPTVQHPYMGKTCPYCQAPFKDEADVVLCQTCNMPHHRDCWRENGNKCTTFGCAGAVAGPLEQSTSSTSSDPLAREPITLNVVTESAVEPASGPQVGESSKKKVNGSTLLLCALVGLLFGAITNGPSGAFLGALVGFLLAALMFDS